MRYKGVALSGRAGSGKTTLARLLVCDLATVGVEAEIVSFGTALKKEVEELFGLTKDDPDGRDKLVEWGEKRRNDDPLYWVNAFAVAARSAWRRGRAVVCDDLRFLSELGWCHASGFDLVRLEVPAHVAASRIPQPPDPRSAGERELAAWGRWSYVYPDLGSLDLDRVARELVAAVERRLQRVAA